MNKFHSIILAALSFIILLCLEDAQGQFLSRSNLRFQRRRTRADQNQRLEAPHKPNDFVVNQVGYTGN